MTASIVAGSLAAVARQTRTPVAEQLLDVERVILVDCSSSMQSADSRGGRRRIDVAREELARLQHDLPGKIALVCFSGHAQFVWGGVPPEPVGSTALHTALDFARQLDVRGVRFVVVSDGEPDDAAAALAAARQYGQPISTVYVGAEGGPGADFLRRLATVGKGRHATADRARDLADALRPLLTVQSP